MTLNICGCSGVCTGCEDNTTSGTRYIILRTPPWESQETWKSALCDMGECKNYLQKTTIEDEDIDVASGC